VEKWLLVSTIFLDLNAKLEKNKVSFTFASILKNPREFMVVPDFEFMLNTIPASILAESLTTCPCKGILVNSCPKQN
jgi:hypothetical protein